jgi:hypothetical protein
MVRLAANFGMVLGSRWSVNETTSIRAAQGAEHAAPRDGSGQTELAK